MSWQPESDAIPDIFKHASHVTCDVYLYCARPPRPSAFLSFRSALSSPVAPPPFTYHKTLSSAVSILKSVIWSSQVRSDLSCFRYATAYTGYGAAHSPVFGFGRRTECVRDAGTVISRRPPGKKAWSMPSGEKRVAAYGWRWWTDAWLKIVKAWRSVKNWRAGMNEKIEKKEGSDYDG